jgi:hypothetical protein
MYCGCVACVRCGAGFACFASSAAVAVSAERCVLTFIQRMPDAHIQAHDVYVSAEDRGIRWRHQLATATAGSALVAVKALLDAPPPRSSLEQEYARMMLFYTKW